MQKTERVIAISQTEESDFNCVLLCMFASFIRKLAAQSTIYNLWKQRNNVVHNQVSIPAPTIFKLIDREIRNIITARRKRKRYRNLMQIWLT
ncbi:hypothetical protein AtNW77_Chr1g0049411 [Arabidopsis thaliana]|uniref:Uncharacterized protein n=4 Tax=Arabidopsis TaxID=3701 RepID=A0A654EHR6_ARATH|nr:ribonuclease [Arabidopsis thaliana]AEE32514.1 ribonuclease [Arabidopsis thaliana]KAG7649131.1 hypothetical protein ISN45_At01g042010 [Arabidopsis thaliana x Arabidopsis arenosa]KAG7657013.1 hypothetical protein ISN44_As01g041020 [Arabidopsis suecica]VYS48644.1 unnamed protein product [Arabidopsis thaliana]|eukprot:NP_175429.1 ribonuclease [Arabidopsis thaliana]